MLGAPPLCTCEAAVLTAKTPRKKRRILLEGTSDEETNEKPDSAAADSAGSAVEESSDESSEDELDSSASSVSWNSWVSDASLTSEANDDEAFLQTEPSQAKILERLKRARSEAHLSRKNCEAAEAEAERLKESLLVLRTGAASAASAAGAASTAGAASAAGAATAPAAPAACDPSSYALAFFLPADLADVKLPHSYKKSKKFGFPHRVVAGPRGERLLVVEQRNRIEVRCQLMHYEKQTNATESLISPNRDVFYKLQLCYDDSNLQAVRREELKSPPNQFFSEVTRCRMTNGALKWKLRINVNSSMVRKNPHQMFRLKVVCLNDELSRFDLDAESERFRVISRSHA